MAVWIATDFGADDWAAWWPRLQAALPNERLVRDRSAVPPDEIDIALVANPPLGSLHGLPGLRLIQSLWAGIDRLLADAGVPGDVPIARMVDPAMNAAMAQTALWAVLGLQRGFFGCAAQQRAGVWRQPALRRADEVAVAVLGIGRMGRAVARCLAGNGYRVLGWRRGGSARVDRIDRIDGEVSGVDEAGEAGKVGIELHVGDAALPQLLAQAQVVVNLLPLTPATRGLFDAARLAQLPRGAALVNLARGAHVVETDLLAALDSGRLHHAVLDVFAVEPLPAAHRFWSHPSVTVLPHMAAPTDPRSAAAIAARNVDALRAGRPLENLVDRARGY